MILLGRTVRPMGNWVMGDRACPSGEAANHSSIAPLLLLSHHGHHHLLRLH